MNITPEQTKQAARSLHALLAHHHVKHVSELQRIEGRHAASEGTRAFIEVERRPSNASVLVPTLSYILPGAGILLEARLNVPLNYTKLILKCNHLLPEYRACVLDSFGNIVQDQTIAGATIENLREELETLTDNNFYNF